MPHEIPFPLGLTTRKLGPRAYLTEALFYPEIVGLGSSPKQATEYVLRNLQPFIAELQPTLLAQRRLSSSGELKAFHVEVQPPRNQVAWRKPLQLRLHVLLWKPDDKLIVGRILQLGIDVIASQEEKLLPLLQRDALAALRRTGLSRDLAQLSFLSPSRGAVLEWTSLPVQIPSLKERAQSSLTESQPKQTILQNCCSRLNPAQLEPAYGLDEEVQLLHDALTAKPPQSVLLVGPSGVGKSACLRELVRTWPGEETRFYQSSGSRIVAGQSGFGMWEQRCQDLVKEAAKQRAILHLGNLIELMDVGKSECNPTGIASFFRPAIARGELLCVVECTPEQLPLIEKEDPLLIDVFRQVQVAEPGHAEGQAILEAFAQARPNRLLAPTALRSIDRLHRRYATYSAYPGRPLRFLDRLLKDGPRDRSIEDTEVYHAFTRETGLPQALIDPATQLDLNDTQNWFAQRVIGQPDAVEIVVELLATVKAGLARPNRPIASLLFIGPTGVGKTEMAKALAEFLFGSRDRLSRFDMSEYADPISVRRLVGGAFGSEGLLTAAIREQPFSVLLLDEIEKADRSVFDLLLQALGEARLTDAGGRLADFRNTLIIMTSNLGAESYQRGKTGFLTDNQPSLAAAEHFKKAVEAALRPEMFNRLDRIVPFAPLGPEVIRQIAEREWRKVLAREGMRFRNLEVVTHPALLDVLAAKGYDPRYGARPLKRALERELLAPLAHQLNRYPASAALEVRIQLEQDSPQVIVKPAPEPRSTCEPETVLSLQKLALEVQELRRLHQLLEQSSTIRDMQNTRYRLQRQVRKAKARQKLGKALLSHELTQLADLGQIEELQAEVERERLELFQLEEAILVAFHTESEQAIPEYQSRLQSRKTAWNDLLLKLYSHRNDQQAHASVVLFSEHRGHLFELEQAYLAAAKKLGILTTVHRYFLLDPSFVITPKMQQTLQAPLKEGETHRWAEEHLFNLEGSQPRCYLMRARVSDKELENKTIRAEHWIGTYLRFIGNSAGLYFEFEAGLHVIRRGLDQEDSATDVLVLVPDATSKHYAPPEQMTRHGQITADRPRRVYDATRQKVTDVMTSRVYPWDNRLENVIPTILETTGKLQLAKVILGDKL